MPLSGENQILPLISLFKAHLLSLHKSPITSYSYGRDIETIARWYQEHHSVPMRIDDLHRSTLDTFYTQRKITPSVRRHYESAARAFSRWLHENAFLAPLEGVDPEEDHALTEDEVRRLCEIAGSRVTNHRTSSPARTQAILALLLEGLSVAELCVLQVSEINSEGVKITRSGDGQVRMVTIQSCSWEIVAKWLELRVKHLTNRQISDTGLLFPGANGREITPRAVERLIKRISAEAGIQATPRRLRLTCVQRLRAEHVPPEQIAWRLGLL